MKGWVRARPVNDKHMVVVSAQVDEWSGGNQSSVNGRHVILSVYGRRVVGNNSARGRPTLSASACRQVVGPYLDIKHTLCDPIVNPNVKVRTSFART